MTVKKSKETEKMLPPAKRKVAPDGGWAWMVCFGVSLVNRNAVERQIRRMIEALSEAIRDNNLNPLQINRLRIENSPMPGLDIDLLIQDVKLLGASDIQIERLIWNTVGSRLRLTVILPRIFSSGKSYIDVNYNDNKYRADGFGEFIMERLMVSLDIRVNVGVISGISRSAANLVINGEDYSDAGNTLINIRIPRWTHENQNRIDLFLSEAIKTISNAILENR